MINPNGANLEDPSLPFDASDYNYLIGHHFQSSAEYFCMKYELGTFGKPTKKGQQEIDKFRKKQFP